MENFVLIAGYLLIGLVLQRSSAFPQNTGQVLNAYVIYVALPALVLQKVPGLEFSSALIIPAVLPWLLLGLVMPVILYCARRWQWSRSTTGALLIIIPLGNTSFIGFPMIEAFFGSQGLPIAVLYDQLGSFLGLAVVATIIAAVYSAEDAEAGGQRPSAWQITRRILVFPPFIALVAAFALKPLEYPPLAHSFINSLAITLVPVIMVAVGFQLKFRLPKGDRSPLVFALVAKLVVMPAAALLLLWPFGFDSLVVQVSLMEAAMPSMISAGALAIMAGLAPTLAAAIIGYGVILCFVTLPLWFALLQVLQS